MGIDPTILSSQPERSHQLLYTLRDRLGSATTMVDHQGNIITQRYFDPFGRTASASVAGSLGDLVNTNRNRHGFTDHEHLNEQQLIHMNGRVYDYNLGRLLSVDPFIQSPTSTQSVNPYSYIMNNPLAGTDPTGYKSIDISGRRPECGDIGGCWDKPIEEIFKQKNQSNRNNGSEKSQSSQKADVQVDKIGGQENKQDIGLTDKEFTTFMEKHVSHESEIDENFNTVESEITKELLLGLRGYAATELGAKVIRGIMENGKSVLFTEGYFPGDGYSANDLSDSAIQITYTSNIDGWKQSRQNMHKGNEINSATIGSLIAHEFGHTSAGRAALGLNVIPQRRPGRSQYDPILLKAEEVRATTRFENVYRRAKEMPMRTHYADTDVRTFNGGL